MNTFQFSPGLTQLHFWAREQQDDSDLPADERDLWQRIADQIDAFYDSRNATRETDAPSTGDLYGGPR